MKNYAEAGRKAELEQQRDAALIKLDRALGELEQVGASRVRDTIEHVADNVDIDRLKSIVYDIDAAKDRYDDAIKELKRLS